MLINVQEYAYNKHSAVLRLRDFGAYFAMEILGQFDQHFHSVILNHLCETTAKSMQLFEYFC